MLPNPLPFFAELPDPRRKTRNKLHKLEYIVMITLCAVLGGFEDWVSIEDFGYANEEWLRGFLALPNGIPSHDTLSDVIGRMAIRHHWAIENQQHWILDVQFGEDAHRTRKDHSAANLGMIRRAALNLLQQDTSNKWSIRRRKMRANFDLPYRESILQSGAGN
jgi:hypothetical protein